MPTASASEGQSFTCDRCGHCCRTHRVPLTHVDLKRLREVAAAPLAALVEFLDPGEVDWVGEPETVVCLREGLRVLVLAHRGGGCGLLTATGCSAHSLRPSACRTYPFDRPSSPETLLDPAPGIHCPETTGVLVLLQSPAASRDISEFRQLIAERDEQLRQYAQAVRSWNLRQRSRIRMRKPAKSSLDFLAYLLRTTPSEGPSSRQNP